MKTIQFPLVALTSLALIAASVLGTEKVQNRFILLGLQMKACLFHGCKQTHLDICKFGHEIHLGMCAGIS